MSAQSYEPTDTEGVWFSGYEKGYNSIELNLTQIEKLGKLEIQFNRWAPFEGYARCQYVFAVEPGLPAKALVNGAYGQAAQCPAGFSVTLERSAANGLLLGFERADFLTKAEMNASLRPFRAADARVPVAGLDILGLAPGMARADVEAVLEAAGYELDRDEIGGTMGRGWEAQALNAVKRDAPEGASDIIGVQFTPVFEGESPTERLELVGRNWEISASEQLSEITLKQALTQKYGAALNGGSDWAYDRAGAVLATSDAEREACKPNGLQRFVAGDSFPGWSLRRSELSPSCGPRLTSYMRSDSSSGRAERLILVLYDPDIAWDRFWTIWSRDELRGIETLYDGVSNATAAAPKL
ncbi:hypothetical protein [Albirhodobacter sp. R86504]|uniref:hypothetical protein n=1 Tax=Albirhodobacter sp. R86504 TaxID=3093848 RepID=UPI00366DFD44